MPHPGAHPPQWHWLCWLSQLSPLDWGRYHQSVTKSHFLLVIHSPMLGFQSHGLITQMA